MHQMSQETMQMTTTTMEERMAMVTMEAVENLTRSQNLRNLEMEVMAAKMVKVVSRSQNLNLSRSQNLNLSRSQNLNLSRSQNLNLSRSQNLRNLKMELMAAKVEETNQHRNHNKKCLSFSSSCYKC
jgi:hypothetical protein